MERLLDLLPPVGTAVVAVLALVLAHRLLERTRIAGASARYHRQLVMVTLTVVAAVAILMVVPISDAKRGQLLTLIGIVVSAAVALSATTFLGNALAGFMLRSIRGFRIGDFIRCGDHFGRVSERGLLHTEIQTEDRDLTTLPNLYLVTHPVTTVRASGTIVSTTVSLGYDVPRSRIERCLLAAAESTGLQEPFVQVLELGDFSVVYRIAGLLAEVKSLLTVRSRLRAAVIDELHGAGIEIVSPSFMNQRVLDPARKVIPRPSGPQNAEEEAPPPEAVVFDKAEKAASLEALRTTRDELQTELDELTKRLEEADEADRASIEGRIRQLEARRTALDRAIEAREAETGR